MNWINFFGFMIALLMVIPNVSYVLLTKQKGNKCKNKILNTLEQITKVGALLLMAFPIGVENFGFRSKNGFVIWAIVIFLLLLIYWISWLFFLHKPIKIAKLFVTIIPGLTFAIHGIILKHFLLFIFALAFTVLHIIIMYVECKEQEI